MSGRCASATGFAPIDIHPGSASLTPSGPETIVDTIGVINAHLVGRLSAKYVVGHSGVVLVDVLHPGVGNGGVANVCERNSAGSRTTVEGEPSWQRLWTGISVAAVAAGAASLLAPRFLVKRRPTKPTGGSSENHYVTSSILAMALAEAVATYGVVLGFKGAPQSVVLPFFVGAWILMLIRFPTPIPHPIVSQFEVAPGEAPPGCGCDPSDVCASDAACRPDNVCNGVACVGRNLLPRFTPCNRDAACQSGNCTSLCVCGL